MSSEVSNTQSVAGFFDGYATDFDAIYGVKHTMLNRWINRVLRKSMLQRFELTIQGCDPIQGKTVIDIGCGPGHYAIALAQRGAAHVHGIDFAPGMLEVARRHAQKAGVADKCAWTLGDFLEAAGGQQYDYAIGMGLMDYIAEPLPFLRKVLGVAKRRAFISFPLDGGFLAWQRKIRYRSRCPLFMYSPDKVTKLLTDCNRGPFTVTKISRDLFAAVDTSLAPPIK